MRALFFFLFLSGTASAAPLQLLPVGGFGGYRVKTGCLFGAATELCTLDTMGSVSVVGEEPAYAGYPVIGHERVIGIGQDFSCDVIDVTDLTILGQRVPHFSPLRCEGDNAAFPLVGLPFFGQRTFSFDFPASLLTWDTPVPPNVRHLERIGGEKLWIALQGQIGGSDVMVAFDTGNPVTIVNQAFVTAHAGIFHPSLRPISPGLAQKGLKPFEISVPIVVGGVSLSAPLVYVAAANTGLFFQDAAVILGMNHSVKARWWFDLGRDLYSVQLP